MDGWMVGKMAGCRLVDCQATKKLRVCFSASIVESRTRNTCLDRIQNTQWLILWVQQTACSGRVRPISDEPEKEADAHPSGTVGSGSGGQTSGCHSKSSVGKVGVQNEIWWVIWVERIFVNNPDS